MKNKNRFVAIVEKYTHLHVWGNWISNSGQLFGRTYSQELRNAAAKSLFACETLFSCFRPLVIPLQDPAVCAVHDPSLIPASRF